MFTGVFDYEMNEANKLLPFFEVLLELHDINIVYKPSIDLDDACNLMTKISSLLEDIVGMGVAMNRIIFDHPEENYINDIIADPIVNDMYATAIQRVVEAIDKCFEFTKTFKQYSPLWLDDRQEFLKQFLLYGRALTDQERELLGMEGGPGIKESPPTIPAFKKQIDYYEELYKKVEKIDTEKIINRWLRIDIKPLRQAILNTVCKWSNMFKQHLVERVKNSIEELEEFIKNAIAGMQVTLDEDDYEGLLKVMGFLFQVKERQDATDVMFEPLHEIIELLKTYGVEFPEELHVQLAELPDKWLNCKKVALTTKQQVAPLQANQANAVRKRISLFDIRQNMYRDYFKKGSWFKFDCKNVYKKLDKCNSELKDLENDMAKITEQANLFEVNVPEFKSMKITRKELKLLKQLWDFVLIVG